MYCQPCMLLFEPIFTPFVSYHSFPPTSYYRTILFLTSKVELWCRYFVTHFQYLWFLRRTTDFRPLFISTNFLPTKCVLATPYPFWHDVLKHFQNRSLRTYLRFHRLFEMPISSTTAALLLPVNVSLFCISLWTSSRPLRGKCCVDLAPGVANQSDF